MKTRDYVLPLVACGLLVPAVAWAVDRTATDALAAVVCEEVITVSDILTETRPMEQQLEKKYQGEELGKKVEELRRDVGKKMVETELLYAEFKEKEYKLPPEYFAKRLDGIILAQAGGNRERFDQMLFSRGMSWDDFEKKVTKMAAVDLIVDQLVRRAVHVSPTSVRDYYDQHRADYVQAGRLRLSMIFLKKDGAHAADLAATIKLIQGKLAEKVSFAELAKSYSEGPGASTGGDLGWILESEAQKEFREAVRNLKVNEVSEAITTEGGTALLLLAGRDVAQSAGFTDSVSKAIETKLRAADEEKRYKEFVETLSRKFYVKLYF